MFQYANSKTPMTYVYVPVTGSSVKYGTPSNEARKTTAALVHWLADLNLHGYSLNGNMTSADFGISRRGCLRGEQQLLKKVVESKNKYVKKDMKTAADIIQNDIYASHQLNPDVSHLLSLLKQGQESNYPLIIRHICHIREEKMSVTYTRMYNHLMTLKIENRGKYDRIIKQLPHANDWIGKVVGNIHLLSLLRFRRLQPGQLNPHIHETKAFLNQH